MWLEARGKANAAILPKHASVAMIGLWGSRDQFKMRLETTSCNDDVVFGGSRLIRDTPGSAKTADGVSVYNDIITKQRVLTVSSKTTLNRHALEEERLGVAKCLLVAGRHVHPRRGICSLRVDEVTVKLPKRSPEKLKRAVEEIQRKDLAAILPPGCVVKH